MGSGLLDRGLDAGGGGGGGGGQDPWVLWIALRVSVHGLLFGQFWWGVATKNTTRRGKDGPVNCLARCP